MTCDPVRRCCAWVEQIRRPRAQHTVLGSDSLCSHTLGFHGIKIVGEPLFLVSRDFLVTLVSSRLGVHERINQAKKKKQEKKKVKKY